MPIKLSTLAQWDEPFVLLAPSFTGKTWLLLRDVQPVDEGPGVWFCEYDRPGTAARGLRGKVSWMELDCDVAPSNIDVQLDSEGYHDQVEHIRHAIARGDVYQVNLTLRATCRAADGAALFTAMTRRGLPRFAAWWKVPAWGEGISASPELLFQWQHGVLSMQPMKGTAHPQRAHELLHSPKDAAELAMITDLVRDDLQHLCQPRSVVVEHPQRVIALPYALQTVAEVRGLAQDGLTLRDVLKHVHPAGSVTGAPRTAAMELIASLEPQPRGPYCGSLGWSDSAGACFCVLIRSAWRLDETRWCYGVGSGITWASRAEAELAEVQLKLGAIRSLA